MKIKEAKRTAMGYFKNANIVKLGFTKDIEMSYLKNYR
jgi:hypothetical protein